LHVFIITVGSHGKYEYQTQNEKEKGAVICRTDTDVQCISN